VPLPLFIAAHELHELAVPPTGVSPHTAHVRLARVLGEVRYPVLNDRPEMRAGAASGAAGGGGGGRGGGVADLTAAGAGGAALCEHGTAQVPVRAGTCGVLINRATCTE
jgi:hypothetical protein